MEYLTYSERNEYNYLNHKLALDKDFDDKEKERFNELQEKWVKEAEYRQYQRKLLEERNHKKEVFSHIKPLCKFKKISKKNCQSRQTGEKTIFYDIELEKYPLVKVYDSETNKQIDKWNIIRGRSNWLSNYACYMADLTLNNYILIYFLPAIKEAYEDYVRENFYGKEVSDNGITWKEFQLDWFDEVYISKDKYKTSFQKWYEETKEFYQKKNISWKGGEPEDWEKAWLDSIEYESRKDWYYFCEDLKYNPNNYAGIKNKESYLKEAEKIIGRKL